MYKGNMNDHEKQQESAATPKQEKKAKYKGNKTITKVFYTC